MMLTHWQSVRNFLYCFTECYTHSTEDDWGPTAAVQDSIRYPRVSKGCHDLNRWSGGWYRIDLAD